MNLDEAIIHVRTKAIKLVEKAKTVRSSEESNIFPIGGCNNELWLCSSFND